VETADEVTVVVADDHPMMCTVVEMACADEDRLTCLGKAHDGAVALDMVREKAPDVLVLDLSLPVMSGFDVARTLRAEGSPAKILILSARNDQQALLEATSIPVDGYLDKGEAFTSIADAIFAVAAGRRLFSTDQDAEVMAGFGAFVQRRRQRNETVGALTTREKEVLELIAEGLTGGQIARRLGVSQKTVESHVGRLYAKLGVRTRTEAVARGLTLQLIPPP
jgi:two-component system, NarL family, nitrate/nitrite response regulator NarL